MSTIGMRLKQERIRVGLSLPELGAIGGVAADAQDDFATGRQSPLADYLARILSTGIDVVYVLTGRPLPPAGRKNMDGVSDPADSVFELYQRQTSLLAKLSEEGGELAGKLAELCRNQLTIIATLKYLASVADAQGYDDVLQRTAMALKALNSNALIIAELMMGAVWQPEGVQSPSARS